MNANSKVHGAFFTLFSLFLLLLLIPSTGFSLDNERWSTGLSFHFYPPGARALAMGGAFVGLADDATAAASNPAGLAQLTRMQIALEGKYQAYDTRERSFTALGDYLETNTSSIVNETITAVSFGALTTPLFNNFMVVSLFYDKPMDFKSNKFESIYLPSEGNYYTSPSETEISLDEVGVSFAKSFFDGKLMLGAGIGVVFLDLEGTARRYAAGELVDYIKMNSEDVGLAFRGGILYRPIEKLRLGASFTIMPEYDYTDTTTPEFARLYHVNYHETSLDVPDTISIGAAYNICPNWAVIIEGRYIYYSQLMNNMFINSKFNAHNADTNRNYGIDDIFEPHFGTEYVLNAIPNLPIALRAGLFYEPDHDLRHIGPGEVQTKLFDGGRDLVHYTFGTGVVLFNHYQIDVGADITEESQGVALSMVYQF